MSNGLRNCALVLAAAIAASGMAAHAQERASLPELPATPVLQAESYPKCREDYQSRSTPLDRAVALNRCTELLDGFYQETLLGYRKRMIDHQLEISRLYADKVGGRQDLPAKDQQAFYERMMKEHADSNPDGVHQASYRALETRYQSDRAYLRDRFCFNTGCGGYPAPVVAKSGEAKNEKKAKAAAAQPSAKQAAASGSAASSQAKKCKNARRGGSALGGLLGGLLFEGAPALVAGGISGLVVGEIACQLTKKEQEKAAQATVEVTKKEEVGAVSTWQSPTRAGVSGSSAITAVNTMPNGKKCLSITDVAIIDGAETRVQKQMCRGQGDSGYMLVA